jgi:CRISPR/Cas system-associated protein Cas5 (RAMP superfamily)
MSFSDVIETIKNLSFQEKKEIQALLAQYLREERREEIYDNYQKSISEEQKGELNFSSNIDELKQLIKD